MLYYDTETRTATDKESATTIPSDDTRVVDFFKRLPKGYEVIYDANGIPTITAIPELTQAELDAQAAKKIIQDKWNEFNSYQSQHTVIINSHEYAANKESLISMRMAIDSLADNETDTWIEDWESFQTDKVELGLALTMANQELRTYRNTLFGTV